MTEPLACLLCGNEGRRELRVALVEWKQPIDNDRWSAIPRCLDVDACKQRVADLGDDWPLTEPRRVA